MAAAAPTRLKKPKIPKQPEVFPVDETAAGDIPMWGNWRDTVEAIKEDNGFIVRWMVNSYRGLARVTVAEKLSKPQADHLVYALKEFTKDATRGRMK